MTAFVLQGHICWFAASKRAQKNNNYLKQKACSIINAFIVIFDQFNAFLLNKINNILKIILT